MTPEKQIQNKILKFLKDLPDCYVERRQAGGLSYKVGMPDVWCLYAGTHVEIEVKAPGGTRSMAQLRRAQDLIRAGGAYICADNFDLFLKQWNDLFSQNSG